MTNFPNRSLLFKWNRESSSNMKPRSAVLINSLRFAWGCLTLSVLVSPATMPVTKESRSIRGDDDYDDNEDSATLLLLPPLRILTLLLNVFIRPRFQLSRLECDRDALIWICFEESRGLHYANGGPVIAELIGDSTRFFLLQSWRRTATKGVTRESSLSQFNCTLFANLSFCGVGKKDAF